MPPSEPGRSLGQDVTLHLEKAIFPAQPAQVVQLGAALSVLAGKMLAGVSHDLSDPIDDRLTRRAEITRQLD